MRLLVCGGRDYDDHAKVHDILGRIHRHWGPITLLIHGYAEGADTIASLWAYENGIKRDGYAADWRRFGKPAGPIRNQKMLDDFKPDLVVAFPGGSGTADMVSKAKAAQVRVVIIRP